MYASPDVLFFAHRRLTRLQPEGTVPDAESIKGKVNTAPDEDLSS